MTNYVVTCPCEAEHVTTDSLLFKGQGTLMEFRQVRYTPTFEK